MTVILFISQAIYFYLILKFQGWECDGEHFLNLWVQWSRETDQGTSILKRLIACAVPDLPDQGNEDEAADFGFAAEAIGDVLFLSLQRYSRDFSSLLFLTGDNAAVNVRLANLITSALRAQGNDVLVSLVGCANHGLNLAVKLL